MLTAVIAWYCWKTDSSPNLVFIASIIGDVTIVYYIASAIAGKSL